MGFNDRLHPFGSFFTGKCMFGPELDDSNSSRNGCKSHASE